MRHTNLLIMAICGLVLAGIGATTPSYGKTLSTSDFGGDLQAAVDAASDNDTVVVDVPSVSTFLPIYIAKRLHIRGTEAGYLESRRGIYLLAGSSGTSIRHLLVQPPVGMLGLTGIYGRGFTEGDSIDDVSIEHCSIVDFRRGIRARYADRWQIHHNTILNCRFGIELRDDFDDFAIHHNNIIAESWGIRLLNIRFGPRVSENITIFDNVFESTSQFGFGFGVLLHSRREDNILRSIDIKNNDFTLTDFPVHVFAAQVFEDKRSEDPYVLDSSFALGVVDGLAVRKNTY